MGVARKKEIEQLATRLKNLEDTAAYHKFADVFGPRFRSLFRSKGLTASEAEDLACSCITDIALKIEKYRPQAGGGFESWVFKLAQHAVADWWRQYPIRPLAYEEAATPELDLARGEEAASIREAVQQSLKELSAADREVIQLREFGGLPMTFSEIGTQLGIQTGTARVRYHRALKKLAPLLLKNPRLDRILKRVHHPDSRNNHGQETTQPES